jgi:IstB-like ATP binding protein
VFDGRAEVARHERATRRGQQTLVLDHYLEVLTRKPGALAGSTALAQARAAGSFTPAHDAFWGAAATDAAIDQACRMLRLPTIRDRAGEVAAAAQREQLTYAGFLAELLLAECDDRDRRRSARRLKAAGFPREKWLTDFDDAANPNIAPAVIANLATCAWIAKGEPLCLIGDSGTGKSHLLIALGAHAAQQATGSSTCSPPSWPTSWWRPPTTDSCRKPLPATAELIFCAWTSSATWSWTGVGPSCRSRC